VSSAHGEGIATAGSSKAQLRRKALESRAARPPVERAAASAAIAQAVTAKAQALAPRLIAAYIPFGSEPGSTALLDELSVRATVVVPVVRADGDLDWVAWTGADDLVPAGAGGRMLRPIGPTLGSRFIADANMLLVPALLVDLEGTRLGRGAGSYDRALARVARAAPVAALLFDGELVQRLPAQEWDVPVSAVVTPGGGWTDLPQ
jgi:5-formyltetrahydrofolate cyclo-ligase